MSERRVLVTGGAGFVGSNLAHRLLGEGWRVVVFDNLSRDGATKNLEWLRRAHGGACDVRVGDVRDAAAVREAMDGASHVFHLAAQVAVTTSLDDPRADFEANALGTINVLEAARAQREAPAVFYTSTNKVYGALGDVALRLASGRYEPERARVRDSGISESQPLDFRSPYGCSKGCADQYVRDYARAFGLRTVVFRMSCIYGPRQFGTEDQGWLAHFFLRALRDQPITIYGDGAQVRDVLFVGDLVNAFLTARDNVDALSGSAFNIGGGPTAAVSLNDVLRVIERLVGVRPKLERAAWRIGDQRWYVSDTSAFSTLTGWRPQVRVLDGLARLHRWLAESGGPAARVVEGSP